MNDAPTVSLEISAGIAVITLLRSARMNAFNETLHEALFAAFERADADSTVRAIIITGAGRAFSAGQDLDERSAVFEAGGTPDLGQSLQERYNPLVRKIAQIAVPVIAAVNGIAYGAGAAIAIGCDVVLAAQSARFQFGFVNVGLGPDSGASWYLPRRVGQVVALDLALTGRLVSAKQAVSMGLASRVVADEDLLPVAHEIANGFCAASPAALAAIKALMRANPVGSLNDALDAECAAQAALGRTEEYRSAVLRFAKRAR